MRIIAYYTVNFCIYMYTLKYTVYVYNDLHSIYLISIKWSFALAMFSESCIHAIMLQNSYININIIIMLELMNNCSIIVKV